jgi:hypothetical protein
MQSKAVTVQEYLASLPADRRAAIAAVRDVILANLDKDIEEGMSYGMIGYAVPHRIYPAGYHCDPKQPLPFAGLASQKQHMSLYLMATYCGCDETGEGDTEDAKWFRAQWAKTGKKLDMGKSCIRFKKLEDLALDVIAAAIKRVTARQFIESYEKGRAAATKPAARASAPTPRKATGSAAKAGKPAARAKTRSSGSTRAART